MSTGSVLAQFTITLSQAASELVSVDWYTSDGTALAGVDYAANKGTVHFAAGETAKTVDILVYGRAVGSEDRSFFVEMLPPVNAILGASIGECIIHVDTTGSTPVTQIIVPTGPQGAPGEPGPEGPAGPKGDTPAAADIADSEFDAKGTGGLTHPDVTTIAETARRVAYVAEAKIATVVLSDGDNIIGQSDLTGDTVDMSCGGLYPRVMRGPIVISPQWSIEADGRLLVKSAVAGDVLYVCQYDLRSDGNTNSNERALWRRALADVGLNLVDGSFEDGATAGSASDAIWHRAAGKCYMWKGVIPPGGKVVPKNSTPTTAGGVSPALWVDTLAVQLSGDDGSSFVGIGGGRSQADKNAEWVSVTDAPYNVKFDNTTDNTAGLNAAFQSGKKIWIPHPGAGNYALVNGPVYFDDGVEVQGPGKWVEVIRASSTFPHNVDVVSPLKLSQGSSTPTKHFAFRDFLINANGWTRSIGVADSCSGLVLAACEEYEVSNVVSKNSPMWNFRFSPFNSYADLGHLGQHTSPNKLGRVWGLHSEDFLDGDGFIVEGTEHLEGYGCTHTTTAQAKLLKNYTRTHTGFQVVEGSKHVIFEKSFVDGGGTQMTAYGAGAHVNRPAVYDVLFKDSDAKGVNRLLAVWSDPATDISFDDPRWACREIRAENCKLTHPIVDPNSATLPARVVDLQYVKDSHSKHVSVEFTGEPDESPVAIINFGPGVDCTVDGFTAKGVPGIPANTYSVDRNCGWVRTSETTPSHSSGLVVRNISLDNIGFVNRVVHDSGEKAFVEIDGITVDAIPSDGQEKVGVVSGSLKLDIKRVKGPAGFVRYKLGRSFSAFPYDDVSVRTADISEIDTVIGGLRIRSETNAGVQPVPGILFDRQFSSGSDPTGLQGKGNISWRTTAATEGQFSFTAYHEDVGEFRPVIGLRSTNSTKSLIPVMDNTVTCGDGTRRFSQYYGVSGSINTSDAREKTDPVAIDDAVMDAWGDVQLVTFKWLEAIARKGEDVARWHFGVIAQQVRDAFYARGLDGTDYGLLCYDEWGDEFEPIIDMRENKETGEWEEYETGEMRQTRVAGNRWGIRPDQCLFLEAAYQRRERDRDRNAFELFKSDVLTRIKVLEGNQSSGV